MPHGSNKNEAQETRDTLVNDAKNTLGKLSNIHLQYPIYEHNAEVWSSPYQPLNYLKQSNSKLQAGNLKDGIDDLLAAIILNPGDPWYYKRLIDIRLIDADLHGAINDLTIAIGLNPVSPCYYASRAAIKLFNNDYVGAGSDAVIAEKLDPANKELYKIYLNEANEFAPDYQRYIKHVRDTLASTPPVENTNHPENIKKRKLKLIENQDAERKPLQVKKTRTRSTNTAEDSAKLSQSFRSPQVFMMRILTWPIADKLLEFARHQFIETKTRERLRLLRHEQVQSATSYPLLTTTSESMTSSYSFFAKNISNFTQQTEILRGTFAGEKIFFCKISNNGVDKLNSTPGSCGYISLNTTREKLETILNENINNLELRKLIGGQIHNDYSENQLKLSPYAMRKLQECIHTVDTARNNETMLIKRHLNILGKTNETSNTHELINIYSNSVDGNELPDNIKKSLSKHYGINDNQEYAAIEELKNASIDLKKAEFQLEAFLYSKQAVSDYIEVNIKKEWMGIRVAAAWAKVTNRTLRIWRVNTQPASIDSDPDTLYLLRMESVFSKNKDDDPIDIIHLDGNHFERLSMLPTQSPAYKR